MKLIYCPECRDVKALRMLELRHCACGASWGYSLEDDLTAEVGGKAIPIAIANDSLRKAIAERPRRGKGSPCSTWVIPCQCDTVKAREAPDTGKLPQ